MDVSCLTDNDKNASDSIQEQASKIQKTVKSSRSRKQTAWFGHREHETNDDALFDDIDRRKQNQSTEEQALTASKKCEENGSATADSVNTSHITNADTNNNRLSVLTPGEKILLEYIMELKKEMTVLQRSVVGVEVRLNERLAPAREMSEFTKIDDDELQVVGLPLSNESDLNEFENKLKKKDFFTQVVRTQLVNIQF